MNENIAGKVVVITGASGGIGEATARYLAANGARVVLGARRQDRLDAIVAEIVAADGEAHAVATDVAKREDVEKLVQSATTVFSRLDVMINNAGLMPLSRLDQTKVDDWERMIDVNLKGVLYGIAAALPILRAQKSGHIINVASTAGLRVRPNMAVYSATKFAVRTISEGLRQEAADYNVRSTIISPGPTDTDLPASVTDADAAKLVDAQHQIAMPTLSVAQAIAFAISQPEAVDVNEIVVRPTALS